MRHETALFYLEGYDREDLGSSLKARIDGHLAECASCAAEAARISPLGSLFSEAAQSLPPGFEGALERTRLATLRRVRQDARTPQLLGNWTGWMSPIGRWSLAAPVALAAALLVILVVSPLRRDSAQAPTTSATEVHGVSPAAVSAPVLAANAASPAPARSFVVVRKGQDVRIEWLRNGHPHQIRKSDSPVAVSVANAQTVTGSEWKDSSGRPAPGSVTYYLID